MFSGLNRSDAKKLATLELLRHGDQPRDRTLDEFARLASQLMGVSGSFVAIIDDRFQYIKCARNLPPLATKVHLDETLCQHSVHSGSAIICNDTRQDPRFASHPQVINGTVIFYAVAPLMSHSGEVFGTLCLTDNKPANPNQLQIDQFLRVAQLTSEYLQSWYSVGRIDPFTGLPNRTSLLNVINRLAFAEEPELYTLIIFDCIDMPRAYELSRYLGLSAVEKLLRSFGPLLRLRLNLSQSLPLYAFATGRYAVLVKTDSVDTILGKARTIPRTQAKITGDIEIQLQTHAGYLSFYPQNIPGQEVIRRGISALHEAIRQDSTIVEFDPVIDEMRNTDFRLLYDLGEAIKSNDQLYLVYQPKISLHTGKTEGMEALLRWNHPEKGNIQPSTIVALVERTSLMTSITQWVIRRTLHQLQEWRKQGLMLPVSINITVSDFSRVGFARQLADLVTFAGLMPADIRIECLETEKVLESQTALLELDNLKSLGFKILLDDFGAGYSNISYLQRIPIDIIKLDRSLISQITTDAGSQTIARNIITMLKELDYVVLAEGVEDKETAAILRQFGCDEAQGYYFARPMTAEQIVGWLATNTTVEKIHDIL